MLSKLNYCPGMLIYKILDPGGKLELYLKFRPETCKNEPLKLFGRP